MNAIMHMALANKTGVENKINKQKTARIAPPLTTKDAELKLKKKNHFGKVSRGHVVSRDLSPYLFYHPDIKQCLADFIKEVIIEDKKLKKHFIDPRITPLLPLIAARDFQYLIESVEYRKRTPSIIKIHETLKSFTNYEFIRQYENTGMYVADYKDEKYANGTCNEIVDAAFKKINKSYTGFLIWRIENMNVVSVPKEHYGTFYDSDSYIIYASTQYGHSTGPHAFSKEIKGGHEYHIHFWLGKCTTSDKAGVAAYKTVELDIYLGGVATQHREVQGNESSRFKSYFKKSGIRILNGGTESALKDVEETSEKFVPKLYKIKGKRCPAVIQLPNISWNHFNSTDVYILHTEKIIFIWVGRTANPIEKMHAIKVAMQIKAESKTRDVVFVDDGYENTLLTDDRVRFTQYLPLYHRVVLTVENADGTETEECTRKQNIRLYRCSDSSGKYRVTEIKSGPLSQKDLLSEDVFIVDHGIFGIWVWVGRMASYKEKIEAMRNARGFVKKKKYPSHTPVTRVVENAEPFEFKVLFNDWKNSEEAKNLNKIPGVHQVGRVTKFDGPTMRERPALAAKSQLLDDGSGTIKKWYLKKFEIVEIPKERNNLFFASDCYIILYNYHIEEGPRYIIYYWMGSDSSKDGQECAVSKATEINNTLGDVAVIARVNEGQETPHFLQLFNGKMRIFSGKSIDYDPTGKNLKTPHHYLLRVEGVTSYNTKAIEVPHKAISLNSNHCFMLRLGTNYYVWVGNFSTGDNREMAKAFAGSDFSLIVEDTEGPDFWYALGGKEAYDKTKIHIEHRDTMPPRLFQCSTLYDNSVVEEIMYFCQNDLAPEDVMLLDAHDIIYIWVGTSSTKAERRLSLETALNYLKSDPTGRDLKTPIVIIQQGHELPTFTGFFPDWDKTLWKHHKDYKTVREELENDNRRSFGSLPFVLPSDHSDFNQHAKYPVSVLTGPKENLPSAIDPLRKELHLTYDDFMVLFKMNFLEFEALPSWKQQELKKKVGIF